MIVVTGSRADTLARLDVFVGGWIVEARFPGDEPAQSSVTGDGPVVRSRPGRKAATAASGSTTSPSPTAGPDDVSGPGRAPQTVRDIIEANRYLVLATADAAGRPWSSPVYFAHIGLSDFFWVSSPDAAHSRNIAVRAEVGIAIFDSQVPIGAGQGVYMSAVAKLLDGDETARGIEAFSCRSVAHGGHEWTSEDVRPDAGLRLYQATADAHWILAKDGQPDHRVPVPLGEEVLTMRGTHAIENLPADAGQRRAGPGSVPILAGCR